MGEPTNWSDFRSGSGCWKFGLLEAGFSDDSIRYLQIDLPNDLTPPFPFTQFTTKAELIQYLIDHNISFMVCEPFPMDGEMDRVRIGAGVYALLNSAGSNFHLSQCMEASLESLNELVPGTHVRVESLAINGPNTLKSRLERLAQRSLVAMIALDVTESGMSMAQGQVEIRRAEGKVGDLAGRVILITREGILRHG